jgi:large subunit ribosomal protein L5
MIPRILEKYRKEVVPAMKDKFGYKSSMAVPKLTKITLNIGTGRIAKDSKAIERIEKDLVKMSGQKPVIRKAKKSIAGFKLREGSNVGMVVTLRGKRMYDFMDRLIAIALPRSRDFRGIEHSAVDQHGNLNIGIREHNIFPEISYESLKDIFGFQVTATTTAHTKAEGVMLFTLLGVPFKK